MILANLIYFLKIVGLLILAVVAIVILWGLASILFYGLKQVFDGMRLGHRMARLRMWLRRLRPGRVWLRAFTAVRRPEVDDVPLRLILTERHAHLGRAMVRTRKAINKAARGVQGLGGTKGPNALSAKINEAQQAIEDYTNYGDDIVLDEEMLKQYHKTAMAYIGGILLLIASFFFTFMNGNILALFFRSLFNISTEFLGLKVYQIFGIGFVVAELVAGLVAGIARQRRNTPLFVVMIAVILLAALFEAFVLGVSGSRMHFNIPIFEQSPILQFWLAPLGLIFVASTSAAGYMIHEFLHDIMEARAARRLRSETRALRKMVRELPGHWDGIRRKAHAAQNSVDEFMGSLDNRGGFLTDSIAQIQREHEAVQRTLSDCRLEDWPRAVNAGPGDVRAYHNLNFGLTTLAVLAFVSFVAGLFWLLANVVTVFGGGLAAFLALVGGIACIAIGTVAYHRIMVLKDGSGHAEPIPSGAASVTAAAVMGVAMVAGMMWLAIAYLGWRGVAIGLLLAAGGAALTFVGYMQARIWDGTVDLGNLAAATAFAGLLLLVALLVHALLWPFVLVVAVLLGLIAFLAWPLTRFLEWRGQRVAPVRRA